MSITIAQVKETVRNLCDIVIENEVPFCELDSVAGDGDFGMSLAKGFRQVKAQIDDMDNESIYKFLRGCGMILYEFCGGASGPIWGSGFTAAASCTKGKTDLELEDLALMFSEAVAAIRKRGGASRGDKTLLDALIPAAEALKEGADNGKSIKEGLIAAASAAEAGAESTKTMVASKGRASYLGQRSLNHSDAGASAIAIIMKSLLNQQLSKVE